MSEKDSGLDLSEAEAALERGDYGQCLDLLLPLAETHPPNSPEGPRLRYLMITAWMGQGQDDKAIATCRLLSRCRDPKLRQQAQQLLEILEAPSLDRPERWSMTMPQLEMNASGSGQPSTMRRRRSRRPEPPPPPPTGPTRPPAAGFAVLVLAVLLGITLLLSGCVRIQADLELRGPDRLALTWDVQSTQERSLPWQDQFERDLEREVSGLKIKQSGPGHQQISSGVASSHDLAQQMAAVVEVAGRAAGISLPAPVLKLEERNWLLGVQQHLQLIVDLSNLPEIPGLELHLSLNHGRIQSTAHSGTTTEINWRGWRWNPLGLGGLVILMLLTSSMLLQVVRRKLGFGFPELPS